MSLVALDFESEAIDTRPLYPPKPVGLAIYIDGELPLYMAWGHPIENNCVEHEARTKVLNLFKKEDRSTDTDHEFIFHNAPFDCSIIEEKWGLSVPWERIHDTMLQAFLLDPFGELSLKPLAEKHLGEAPVERDAVREWLVTHGVVRANDKSWGAHISKAPGNLVGTYAIGDVRKTLNLYKKFKADIERRSAPQEFGPMPTIPEAVVPEGIWTTTTRPLKERIAEAIAWGIPDKESVGMSQSELTSLLAEAKKAIP